MFTVDFDRLRPAFGGKLSQKQVDGINAIIAGYNKWGDENEQRLSQVLATARWETAHTMQPVKETFNPSRDKTQPSDETVIRRLNTAFKAGKLPWVSKPYWKEGWFGRGLVQLTHEANYKGPARDAVLKEFGVDIYKKPELLLRLDISVFVLIKGSLEGWFTGKKLAEYIDDLDEDDAQDLIEYIGARRVVNGKDRAKEIATMALQFEGAVVKEPDGPVVSTQPTAPEPATPHETPAAPRRINWFKIMVVLAVLGGLAYFILKV